MKKSILLVLILSAAVTMLNLSAADTAADFQSWAESRQIITLDSDYPEYRIIDSESLETLPGRAMKPWTGQLRVAGFSPVEGGLIIAVNSGYPLMLSTGGGGPALLSAPDRTAAERFLELSRGLTLGTVFSDEEHAFFHLYRDDFFTSSSVGIEDFSGHPVLIEFGRGASGEYSVAGHDYDFPKKNPGWEPVEYLRKDGGSLIAWKYSDDKKTRFRYIRHGSDGESIDEIDEGFFRDEYSLMAIEAGPFALRGFIRAARDGSAGPELSEAGDIYLRLAVNPEGASSAEFPIFYHSPAPRQPSASARRLPVQLTACSDGDLWYILSGNEVLLCGSNISRWKLPELPDGFVYEELWVSGRDMIVSWEERRFPFIGRSGMMYIRLRDIIN